MLAQTQSQTCYTKKIGTTLLHLLHTLLHRLLHTYRVVEWQKRKHGTRYTLLRALLHTLLLHTLLHKHRVVERQARKHSTRHRLPNQLLHALLHTLLHYSTHYCTDTGSSSGRRGSTAHGTIHKSCPSCIHSFKYESASAPAPGITSGFSDIICFTVVWNLTASAAMLSPFSTWEFSWVSVLLNSLQCKATFLRKIDCERQDLCHIRLEFDGKLIERNVPPWGGFLFTMFPDQEPAGRGPPLKNHPQN